MTRELGPTARSLLAAARQGLAPDTATAARVRARVGKAIVAGERVAIATTALKVIAVLALAAAVTTIAIVVRRPSPAVRAPAIALTAGEVRDDMAPPVRSTAAEAPPPPAPVAVQAIAHAMAPDVPSLAREVALVDRAMASLGIGDPDGALATIAQYDRETAGAGQLAEDAAAIAIEAHCARHDSVTIELDDFDRQWPSSAQRPRLAAACAR